MAGFGSSEGIPIPDSKKKKETKEASEDDDHEKMAAIFMKDAKALGIIKNLFLTKSSLVLLMLNLLRWHGNWCMENITAVTT
ncbi:unnamed protein product [Prunus armeniaca]